MHLAILLPPLLAASPAAAQSLPVTGLTSVAAEALIRAHGGAGERPSAGCSWTVAETRLEAGEVLLYRAERCHGRTTHLAYSHGGRRGATGWLRYATASSFPEVSATEHLIDIFPASGTPAASIMVAVGPTLTAPADRRRCHVRAAREAHWPADALVVDDGVPAAQGDLHEACGEMGYSEDTVSYWRVSQHRAWFYDLGQEGVDIDPTSLTVVRQGPGGRWVVA